MSTPGGTWRPHRPSRALIALAIVVLAAYGGLLVLYAISGHTNEVGADAEPPAGGVLVDIRPRQVDAAVGTLTVDIDITPDESLLDESRAFLRRFVTLVIEPTSEAREITFPAGRILSVAEVELELDGDIRTWPVDRHTTELFFAVFSGDVAGGELLESTVHIGGEVQGWQLQVEVADAEAAGASSAVGAYVIDARRSGSTLAFAVILLLVLVALPVASLFVAVNTFRRHRRAVQATFMSWMAAMLFATLPIRNFFPGSPPAGSWVDAIVVLWVIVGLVVALGIYVAAWYEQSRPT